MNDNSLLSEEIISNKIYFIRNQKVMLDRDLALLYGNRNQKIKRTS
nr:ORF6N domain-containing protein [uncultured Flavobacterium sp.]